MAIPPAAYGYPKAAITADKLPLWMQPLSRFSVGGPADWKVTGLASMDRGIRVAAGTGSGDGVTDVTFEYETLSIPAPTIASRWYTIVRRRNWSGTGTSTLVAVPGTDTKALATVNSSGRRNEPGVVSDQPLALVLVTQTDSTVKEIIDLRCWASNGGVEVVDRLALDYLATPGAAVKLGGVMWRYEAKANGVWGWDNGETGWTDLIMGTTPGVPNVRHAGWWERVKNTPAQARLAAGGTMIQVRGELVYVNRTEAYLPAERWVVATLPVGMTPSADAFIMGTSAQYSKAQLYVVNTNRNITIGPAFSGRVAHFNGLAPM